MVSTPKEIWIRDLSSNIVSELAKKPSSEVFKRENSRSSTSNLLQRSTSGLNISTSASSSSFYTAGKNVIANAAGAGQPFGDNRTPLQESKSMKNIANVRKNKVIAKKSSRFPEVIVFPSTIRLFIKYLL